MLTESQVIDAVCRHLSRRGWRIESRCSESQRGEDIVAFHRSRPVRVVIEAKGETSSKPASNRHGKAFSAGQATSHISRALYSSMKSMKRGTICGMAFPKNDIHLERIQAIEPTLRKLRLEVFWVLSSGEVEQAGYWQHES